jgi:hypothetical protein
MAEYIGDGLLGHHIQDSVAEKALEISTRLTALGLSLQGESGEYTYAQEYATWHAEEILEHCEKRAEELLKHISRTKEYTRTAANRNRA